jgi:hypothetical protein
MPSIEMKVMMLKNEVMVAVGAVVSGKWEQGRMQVDWLQSQDKVLGTCGAICKGLFQPDLYTPEDGIPWKNDDVLTAVSAEAWRPIVWKFPSLDGSTVTARWETHHGIQWVIQYDEERARAADKEGGNMCDAAQLERPDRPHARGIVLKLKKGKGGKSGKQPKPVSGPPRLVIPRAHRRRSNNPGKQNGTEIPGLRR